MIRESKWAVYTVFLVPIIFIVVFLVYPVIDVILNGLLVGPGLTLIETISLSANWNIVSFTLAQALLSTIMTIAIGLPGAFILAKLEFKGKSIFRAIMTVPFVLPPIVVVVGFLRMFGSDGILDTFIMGLLGTNYSTMNLASGLTGIVLAHVFYNVPLVVLLVSSSLERLSHELEESAELLGASRLQKLKHLTLPHIKQSLAAASILSFLFCFLSFPIVLALGEGRLVTLEVRIWNTFRSYDFGQASSLALIQLGITTALAFSYVKLSREDQKHVGPTKMNKRIQFSGLEIAEKAASLLYLSLLLLLIAGPMMAIADSAFYDPFAGIYTLRGFANLLETGSRGGLLPLVNTLVYSSLATIFAVILGIPLAYANQTRSKGIPTFTTTLTLLPLGVSAITIAYGLMVAIAVPLSLTTNPWMLIVFAQTILGLPFTSRAIEISLADMDNAVLEQADMLGASRLQRFLFVELPLLAPGILAGGVFAFSMAIGEMSATLFIALQQNTTLSIAIYQYLGVRRFVEAGAAAFLLVAVCFVAFLIIEKMSTETRGLI